MTPDLTPRDLRLIEATHSVFKAFSFGSFAALAIAPFIEHGRLLCLLIGG
jgi:hypothetical protein